MPATTERARPLPLPTLLDDAVPTRRRSPPPYPKLPDSKHIPSPPSPVPPTPKSALSPKTEKKPPPSPPPESDAKKLDKPESKPASDTKEEEESKAEGDIIDMDTFQQILELDDEDGDEFSREMVWAFFSQAESTFEDMNIALKAKDLAELSSLGHFLKGSSAALGVRKVQASCEKMQHYGQMREPESGATLSSKEALERIEKLLGRVKTEYIAAEKWLKNYYKESSP